MTSRARSKERVRSSRVSSGSRPSARVVDPTRSANRIETRRRSATGAPAIPAGWSDAAPVGAAAVAADADAPTGVPQFEQNLAPGIVGVPHAVHVAANAVPHSEQNLAPTRFSLPQTEHCTLGAPPTPDRADVSERT